MTGTAGAGYAGKEAEKPRLVHGTNASCNDLLCVEKEGKDGPALSEMTVE